MDYTLEIAGTERRIAGLKRRRAVEHAPVASIDRKLEYATARLEQLKADHFYGHLVRSMPLPKFIQEVK